MSREGLSTIGINEWLRPGEYQRAERLLADLNALGVTELRTQISWADWHTPAGQAWYDWLLPRLSAELSVLPCVAYTPPSLGLVPKTAAPPREPKAYADFIDLLITRLGDHFEWLELWNEPNNLNDWDWRLDPSWHIFTDMIGKAAYWARQRGKKTVLGGMAPTDPNWLDLMCQRGVVKYIDAVGIHGFPGTWEFDWDDWSWPVNGVRQVLSRYQLTPELWITEAGYSTWRHDEFKQLSAFVKLLKAPVQRIYWYSGHDLHGDLCHQDGFHEDERHYHFGLKKADGQPKLLFRVWEQEGVPGITALAALGQSAAAGLVKAPVIELSSGGQRKANKVRQTSRVKRTQRPVLITGGAGFIGTNLAHRLLTAGQRVVVLDNLSRPGVERNLRWLTAIHGDRLQVEPADIRDPYVVREAVRLTGQVFHFAGQVAVTTSLTNPVVDFEVNARGTLNVLEALRTAPHSPSLVFTSTNKVYGALEDIGLSKNATRYEPRDVKIRSQGIDETRGLDFHSPYGCSKGAADQYVLDYARTYGLAAVVLRMSCIYGPHQLGTEDQGWVAHLLIQALEDKDIHIYGDGLQVRDVLFVDDLIEALLLTQKAMDRLQGNVFNIGGGPRHSLSLLELISLINELHGIAPKLNFTSWRPGDQKYYISDTRRFSTATGWVSKVDVRHGLTRLYQWLRIARDQVEIDLGADPSELSAKRDMKKTSGGVG